HTIVKAVTIAGQSTGGLDALTALNQTEQRWNDFQKKGFTFQSSKQTITLPISGAASDSDEVIIDLVGFDPAKAANQAYTFGHQGSFWRQARERLSGWLGRRHEFGDFSIDTPSLDDLLRRHLATDDKPAVDAGIDVSSKGVVSVTPSKDGIGNNYNQALRTAVGNLRTLSSATVVISQQTLKPVIPLTADLQSIANAGVPAILARTPFTLTADSDSWTLDRKTTSPLLGFVNKNGQTLIGFDQKKTTAYLAQVKKKADIAAQNSRFVINDGKITEFSTSAVGRSVNVDATLTAMQTNLIGQGLQTVALIVDIEQPISGTVAANTLGITELVAEGKTNFKGSPTNRRFNLTLGSEKLNGLIIKPGETFSLVAALGPIDAQHGWKSELVIKGPKITPEFGGGLCQVATTFFRAILGAGLPVVERHNHSLRIHYYEPPVGLDATIYEPKPDLRFTNDYTTALLLQTRVDGNDLYYDFYGTKDNRTIDLPTPKVYNKTGIPPTQTISTTDLKPGEEKCQKPGHPGADATATYTVTYADGHTNKQVFQSHYRALPVICQVGVKPKPTPAPTTNTNSDTNTTPTE
ncbi:MAG: VanW family protein, partial [Candidatus Kerfeldbacteria bacterium]|nr:VanW family protein [Candidatus Kerfeldbacteria bacterium]